MGATHTVRPSVSSPHKDTHIPSCCALIQSVYGAMKLKKLVLGLVVTVDSFEVIGTVMREIPFSVCERG